MSKAKCIMVQGTMSGAGKSLLCAALCRIFAQDGYRVAPFKSQNMALNSFVTRNGAEMGRAQVVQAQAAGVEPDVRMNPILLKPSSDTGSQVIVNGEVRGQLPAAAYFKMKRSLIPDILEAYNSLAAENDIIVIEGAGSPAEINLKADDIVNMGLAKLVDAPVLLVGDIDRGGVFAQLLGTLMLLTDEEKKIDQELSRLVFEDSKGSKLFFELQVLDRLDEYKNLQNGDSISLMPSGIFYIVEKDMRMMGILLLICFAILALPYLIRERLCHVLPLYATTATGRKLLDRQFQALVACCGFVGIVQFGIYVLVYVIKGLAVFWKGDCIDDTGLQLWCKNLPFGFYMLLYMLLVFVFVLAAVVLIYLIGRTAGNYIAGIAFAIPACAGIGFLLTHIFVHLFQKPMDENSLPYSEELWILGWILACACVLWWKMHRDHYRDL